MAASETDSLSPKIFIPEEWSNTAETIANGSVASPIVLVCGAKNSGKTIFSRHLLNVLLGRYFIDVVTFFYSFVVLLL